MKNMKNLTETTWATPKAFFDMLDREFNFTVDVCALPGTAKCSKYFTPEINGLEQDWSSETFGYSYLVIDLNRKHCALKSYFMIDFAGSLVNMKPYFMIDMADAHA